MAKRKADPSRLTPAQKQAAHMLLESQFLPRGERRTREEIAEEAGVSRMQLYRWEHENRDFIAYYNEIADDYLDSQLAFVYAKLLDGIKSGSMKGIELALKRAGKLTEKHEHTHEDKREDSAERHERLLKRLEQISDDTDQ